MNQNVSEIRRVAKETLEGHLRGVVSQLTPEQVNEDRLLFAESLQSETEEDLKKLGLHLDTLKILHVSDEVGYLEATGRKAIAVVVRAAEIAESDARRTAEQSQSEQNGRALVMESEVDTAIVRLQNDLRTTRAQLESEVKSQEERTKASALEARALAEHRLQDVRAQLEPLRLQAERILPAQAEQQAAQFRAAGEAAIIRERGLAISESLRLMADAWTQAGPSATQIALIEDLEKLIAIAGEGISKLELGQVTMVDGPDAAGLQSYMAAYPKMITHVFDAVESATGMNVLETVSGRATKEQANG